MKKKIEEEKFVNKIRVIITDKQKEVKIPTGIRMLTRRCCNAVLLMENFKGSAEISVSFVNNKDIRALNKAHRKVDSETDVLSFPLGEDGKYDINIDTGAQMLGDIVISMEKAQQQAQEYRHSLQREVAYLIAHATLHLLGYDHEEGLDKIRMREKEEFVMNQLGLPTTPTYVMTEEE